MRSIIRFIVFSWVQYLRTRRAAFRHQEWLYYELLISYQRSREEAATLARTVVEKNEVLAKRDEALGKLKLQVSVLQGLHTNQLAGNFVLVEEIIAQSEAIESLQEDRENALQLAYTDPLTGLFTRHGERVITAQLATLKPAGHRTAADAVTVLALDLDRFKSINDTLGHARGDEVLRIFADLIRQVYHRATDYIVRDGGDEVFVVMFETSVMQGARLARELLRLITTERQLNIEGIGQLTASMGLASVDMSVADLNAAYEAAKKKADQAMYGVKRNGRNDIRIA